MTPCANNDTFPRLLGDIGATNARYAWQAHASAQPTEIASYPCRQHESLLMSIEHYLQSNHKPRPKTVGIGIATQIPGDWVQMVNHDWAFSIAAMKQALDVKHLVLVNDFTALALSLPTLSETDLYPIGTGTAVVQAPMAVIGPGTGLGVSGLLPNCSHGRWLPISGEGGHVTLSADNPLEQAVIERLKQRYGHASAERALSGPGLVALYEAVCDVHGQAAQALSAASVMAHAQAATQSSCSLALGLFFAFLGSTAGNLALTLGATGGVFVGGGIVPRALAELERSTFRERFISKGRYRDYLNSIPTRVIQAKVSPALIGASIALDHQLA